MNKPHVYLGIDVAKLSLYVDGFDGRKSEIKNDRRSIASLIKRISSYSQSITVCCEATGGYEGLLIAELLKAQVPVALVNPVRVRRFAQSKGFLVKTDKVDARMITLYAHDNPPRLVEKSPAWLEELRALLIRRADLVEDRKRERARLDPSPSPTIARSIKKHVLFLDKEITRLEQAYQKLIKSTEVLEKQVEHYSQVKSIGAISALSVIAFVPELGKVSDQEAAALVGLAPYNRDSGQMKGRRTTQAGRIRVRKAMYMAALSASNHNPILRAFYKSLLLKGKPKKVALIAVARKLIVLLNRMAADPEFKIA